jgi:hypothetical protein
MQCKTDKEFILKQEDNILQLGNETNEMQVDNPKKLRSFPIKHTEWHHYTKGAIYPGVHSSHTHSSRLGILNAPNYSE